MLGGSNDEDWARCSIFDLPRRLCRQFWCQPFWIEYPLLKVPAAGTAAVCNTITGTGTGTGNSPPHPTGATSDAATLTITTTTASTMTTTETHIVDGKMVQ